MEARVLDLLRPMEMSDEEREFRAWIKKCKPILEGHTNTQKAHLAIANGFDRKLVFQVFSSPTDAMNGTQIDRRWELELLRWEMNFETFLRMRQKLERAQNPCWPLWEDVHKYQSGEAA